MRQRSTTIRFCCLTVLALSASAEPPTTGTFSRTDIYNAQGGGKLPPITTTLSFKSNGTIAVVTTREDLGTKTNQWSYSILPYRVVSLTMPDTRKDRTTFLPWTPLGLDMDCDLIRGPMFARLQPNPEPVIDTAPQWDAVGCYTQTIRIDDTVIVGRLELERNGGAVYSCDQNPKSITGKWESTSFQILEYTQDNGWHGQFIIMNTNLIQNHYPVRISIDSIKKTNFGED